MKRIRIWAKTLVTAAAVCGASPLLAAGPPAQLVSLQDVDARFAALQAEMASLRSRLDEGGAVPMPPPANGAMPMAAPYGAYGTGYGYGDCCCEESGGFIAGFDLVIVKPHFDHGVDVATSLVDPDEPDPTGELGQFDNDWEHHATPRLWLGYVGASGLGARVRYWEFDEDAETLLTGEPELIGGVEVQNVLDSSLEVQALDFEVTQSVCWGALEGNFSGGVRWASVETTHSRLASDTTPFDEQIHDRIEVEGAGPIIGLEVRRPLSGGGLALIGATCASLLFGETDIEVSRTEPGDAVARAMREEDDVFYVLEAQLGVEYGRDMNNGMRVGLRAMAEAQLWGGAAFNGLVFPGGFPDPQPAFNGITARNTVDNDLAFIGATVGITVER